MGITQHTHGTDNVIATANLAMLTGNVGKPSTGVNPLRGQNNVQGACDLGALPNVFTGYQAVVNEDIRKKFEDAWGTHLPREIGITLTEMFEEAYKKEIKAIYLIGENPILSDPDARHVKESLETLDFFVFKIFSCLRLPSWQMWFCRVHRLLRGMELLQILIGGYRE